MAYTTIDKPSDYFNTKLYTGTGSSQSITGVGFQPDFVWLKGRTGTAYYHQLYDAIRGTTKALFTPVTNAEETVSGLTAFGSDGFTVGSSPTVNNNGVSTVAWNWKAGGTASSNTDGSITSSVSSNTTSGFSICTFTDVATSGNQTFGHGLGTTPSMVIVKRRNTSDFWWVWHKDLSSDTGHYLKLNESSAEISASGTWGAGINATTVGLRGASFSAATSNTFVAYCFAEKQGYSKFGSYVGNGNADGTFVYTGFKPAWVLTKKTSGTSSWIMMDNKRNTYNVMNKFLDAYDAGAEGSLDSFDFLSNGFKLRTSNGDRNASGATYIYACFAENPFVTGSSGVPATAR